MNRLIEYIVFSGFVIACRFATCPTSRSPLLVNPTTEGVVRAALLVRDHLRLAAFHHGDHRVRGSQVNSNNLTHKHPPLTYNCFIINLLMIAYRDIIELECITVNPLDASGFSRMQGIIRGDEMPSSR